MRQTLLFFRETLVGLAAELRLRYNDYLPLPGPEQDEAVLSGIAPELLLVKLGGDQIAIIVLAAQQAGLIDAASERTAFLVIMLYVST